MSDRDHAPLPIRESLKGRHIFLTGGSGFVGKVWLAMALTQLPEIERIYVFLRPKALVPARQRFEKMINTSRAFRPLHERYGRDLGAFLSERVEIVEGELTEPDLGLAPALVRRLKRDLDVFIHCAGLVDFNPDLRKALSSNVDATMRVADFVEHCDHASLLHISTCYVAGMRYGDIPETLETNFAPTAENFSARAELAEAHARIDTIVRAHSTDAVMHSLREEVLSELKDQGRHEPSQHLVETLTRKRQREQQKRALEDEGMERAKRLGWHNTYTYSKSLAESLLAQRRSRLRCAVLRPSIVESALEFPEPGWNESFNGSAPLAYIMGSWFRMVPARPDAPFDVIPVDLVSRAMTNIAAALVTDRHSPVYHIGTSDRHRCSVGRAAELIVLSHRRHLRHHQHSRSERVLKSRWDAILVEPDHPLGIKTPRALVRGFDEALDLLPRRLRNKLSNLSRKVHELDDDFAQIEKLVTLYLPFMYESFYVFKSAAIDTHRSLEPEFEWGPNVFDWRKYWLDIHMPGLRRWAFPLIEGKRPERYRAEHITRLGDQNGAGHAARAGEDGARPLNANHASNGSANGSSGVDLSTSNDQP
ncbi:MAG: hypothetical protein RL701_7412 [Pseudomonadota bacterium]|jgi:long-chain acyl-CoA synthetase